MRLPQTDFMSTWQGVFTGDNNWNSVVCLMSGLRAKALYFVLYFKLLPFQFGNDSVTSGGVQHCGMKFAFECSMLLFERLDMRV